MRIEIGEKRGTLYMKTESVLLLPHLFCIKANDVVVLDKLRYVNGDGYLYKAV
jgi:hypothetical protein